MLFDLRSRGRRRTVQVIYIGLAVLIGAGLILFGVGTGVGGGGLLNAGSNGSSNSAGHALDAATSKALAATKKNPNDASAWASLVSARFTAANANAATGTTGALVYSAKGKEQLTLLTEDYARYAKLTSSPSTTTASLAAKAHSQLGQYAASSTLYQTMPGASSSFYDLECVALESYAAGNDRVGALAQARVLAKVPKASRAAIKAKLISPKTTPSDAAIYC